MEKINYYATILRTGLILCLIRVAQCETECRNEIRGELYQCDRGCCGSSPDQYCCAPTSYIAYLIVVAVLVSVLVVVVIVVWYKKKTASRRRTRPAGVVVRMGERRRSSEVSRACIDGSDRTSFNYYHLQWVYGQPTAPPPYFSRGSTSAFGTHALNFTNGNTPGQVTEWQQHENNSNGIIVPSSPPPPYSYRDNTE